MLNFDKEPYLSMLYAIVPVKPLQLAKGRLAHIFTVPERRALVLAKLGDVLAAARERGLATRLFRAPGLELDIDRPDDVLLLAEADGETAAQQLARELCVDARLACV